MPVEVLSGNLEVDTYFMNNNTPFAHQKYRIYYVWAANPQQED